MKIEHCISNSTKQELLRLSQKLKRTTVDKQRALVTSEYYADNIAKIRLMSKRELVKYIGKTKAKKENKLALKIAHSTHSAKVYRMLNTEVKYDMELINYARNRLYAQV